jgi:hypothetical protein
MIENMTASDVANEISMLRSTFKGTFVVVEGITDSRLYGKFIKKEEVNIAIAYSKENVRHSVMECRVNRGDLKIIGIVDPDLDRLNGWEYRVPIFTTDHRDLESMILCTRALDDLLIEYADAGQLKKFEDKFGVVKDVIAKATAPIGMLMFISQRDGLGLCFKDLDYGSFINKRTLENDYYKMIDEVFSLSRSPNTNKKDIFAKLIKDMDSLEDPWLAVRGHDAVAVLAIGLSDVFGSYNCCGMKCGQIGGSLRLAFSYDYFADTELYKDTSEWSKKTQNPLWLNR